MVQWINFFNNFVNPTRLPLICCVAIEILEPYVALVEPGLMTGWLADWQSSWLADEMQVNFKFLKFIVDQIF